MHRAWHDKLAHLLNAPPQRAFGSPMQARNATRVRCLHCLRRSDVEVVRDGQAQRVPSTALVPGDVVVVVPGTLPADMVMLRGEAIVDENMLTGGHGQRGISCVWLVAQGRRAIPLSPFCDGTTTATMHAAPRCRSPWQGWYAGIPYMMDS